MQALHEAIDLRRIELKRAVHVHEMECIEHNAGGVRECIRLDDVHAHAASTPEIVEKSAGRSAVSSSTRTRAVPASTLSAAARAQLLIQRKMPRDLRRGVYRQIPPRESFQNRSISACFAFFAIARTCSSIDFSSDA